MSIEGIKKPKKTKPAGYKMSLETTRYLIEKKKLMDEKFEVLLQRANLIKNKRVRIEVKPSEFLSEDIDIEVDFGDITYHKFPEMNGIYIRKPGADKGDFNYEIPKVDRINLAWVVLQDDKPLEISFWIGFPAIRLEVYMDVIDENGEIVELFDEFLPDPRSILCQPSFTAKGTLTIL